MSEENETLRERILELEAELAQAHEEAEYYAAMPMAEPWSMREILLLS